MILGTLQHGVLTQQIPTGSEFVLNFDMTESLYAPESESHFYQEITGQNIITQDIEMDHTVSPYTPSISEVDHVVSPYSPPISYIEEDVVVDKLDFDMTDSPYAPPASQGEE